MMIEDLLTEITERGWYLYSAYSNPYDRPSAYRWECTLRNAAASLVSFGQGPDLSIALSQALDGIDHAAPGKLPTFTVYKGKRMPDEGDLSAELDSSAELDKIIAKFKPTFEPIARRKL